MLRENNKEIDVLHKTGNLGVRVYNTRSVYCHWHDEYEFIIPDTKPCNCIVNSQNITVFPGQVLLIYPGELHAVSDNGENFTAVVFHPYAVSGEEFKSYVYPKIRYNRVYDIGLVECKEIVETLGEIKKVVEIKSRGYEIMLKSLIVKIAYLIVNNDLYSVIETLEHKQSVFFDILSFVNENFGEKITLDDVAHEVGVSRSYVSRLFRIYAGCSFCDYIVQMRLEKAREELLSSDKSILEISMECGFDNVSYFISKFRKKWHDTPFSYRKNYRKFNIR